MSGSIRKRHDARAGRPSHLPAVAAGPALADGDGLGSPRLADCAEGRGCDRDVSGHVAVLCLGLCDGVVSGLCDWFGDCGSARGHAGCGASEGHGMRGGRLDEADVVDQDCGGFL